MLVFLTDKNFKALKFVNQQFSLFRITTVCILKYHYYDNLEWNTLWNILHYKIYS